MILDYNLVFSLFSKQLLILVSSLFSLDHKLLPGSPSLCSRAVGKQNQEIPCFPSSGATSELLPPPKEGSNHCGWFHMMLEEMIVDNTKPRS